MTSKLCLRRSLRNIGGKWRQLLEEIGCHRGGGPWRVYKALGPDSSVGVRMHADCLCFVNTGVLCPEQRVPFLFCL